MVWPCALFMVIAKLGRMETFFNLKGSEISSNGDMYLASLYWWISLITLSSLCDGFYWEWCTIMNFVYVLKQVLNSFDVGESFNIDVTFISHKQPRVVWNHPPTVQFRSSYLYTAAIISPIQRVGTLIWLKRWSENDNTIIWLKQNGLLL